MFRHRVTSLAIFFILSLLIENLEAHLPLGQNSVSPFTTVFKQTTSDACTVRIVCSANCSFNTGTHNANEFHPHSASALLQAYYYQPGGLPGVGLGLYKSSSESKTLWGQKSWTTPTLSISKTFSFGCWLGRAVSSGSLGYTVNDTTYHIVQASSTPVTKVCSPCSAPAGAPGIFKSTIQENLQEQGIDLDDLRGNLSHAIKSARATNPDVDFAIYFEDRIQTLAFNPDNVYVSESDDSTTLKLGYPDANLTVVELDPLDGLEYQPPAAPPQLKPSKSALTTTWAAVKQK